MIRTLIIALLAVAFAAACASTPPEPEPEPEAVEVVKVVPPPEPEPVPVAEVKPIEQEPELPKTASPLPLLGLAGFGALGLGGALHAIRRRL